MKPMILGTLFWGSKKINFPNRENSGPWTVEGFFMLNVFCLFANPFGELIVFAFNV